MRVNGFWPFLCLPTSNKTDQHLSFFYPCISHRFQLSAPIISRFWEWLAGAKLKFSVPLSYKTGQKENIEVPFPCPSILEAAMRVLDPLRKERAFTLLEVLISLVILSVGLLATLSLTISTVQGNAFGRQMTGAITLAQHKLEELKKFSYSSINPGTTTESNVGANGGSGSYQRVTVVTDNSPVTDMKKITVTVTWTGRQNSSVTLVTLVAR